MGCWICFCSVHSPRLASLPFPSLPINFSFFFVIFFCYFFSVIFFFFFFLGVKTRTIDTENPYSHLASVLMNVTQSDVAQRLLLDPKRGLWRGVKLFFFGQQFFWFDFLLFIETAIGCGKLQIPYNLLLFQESCDSSWAGFHILIWTVRKGVSGALKKLFIFLPRKWTCCNFIWWTGLKLSLLCTKSFSFSLFLTIKTE